jgi:hypothetical protein
MIYTIMASHLGNYQGCAPEREKRFRRACDSFYGNSYPEKQLIVVADGCETTTEICRKSYPGAVCFFVHKLVPFSGLVRNIGLGYVGWHSQPGDIVTYLDTDDAYGPDHLQSIAGKMGDNDFILWPMTLASPRGPIARPVALEFGGCGTASVAHRASLDEVEWGNGYAHDWDFISKMIECGLKYAIVNGPEYLVHHTVDWST